MINQYFQVKNTLKVMDILLTELSHSGITQELAPQRPSSKQLWALHIDTKKSGDLGCSLASRGVGKDRERQSCYGEIQMQKNVLD